MEKSGVVSAYMEILPSAVSAIESDFKTLFDTNIFSFLAGMLLKDSATNVSKLKIISILTHLISSSKKNKSVASKVFLQNENLVRFKNFLSECGGARFLHIDYELQLNVVEFMYRIIPKSRKSVAQTFLYYGGVQELFVNLCSDGFQSKIMEVVNLYNEESKLYSVL